MSREEELSRDKKAVSGCCCSSSPRQGEEKPEKNKKLPEKNIIKPPEVGRLVGWSGGYLLSLVTRVFCSVPAFPGVSSPHFYIPTFFLFCFFFFFFLLPTFQLGIANGVSTLFFHHLELRAQRKVFLLGFGGLFAGYRLTRTHTHTDERGVTEREVLLAFFVFVLHRTFFFMKGLPVLFMFVYCFMID